MAVSEDVMTIVRILDEEGFGVLAGELLVEINLGREVEKDRLDETGQQVHDDDRVPQRVPLLEGEQLAQAMQYSGCA